MHHIQQAWSRAARKQAMWWPAGSSAWDAAYDSTMKAARAKCSCSRELADKGCSRVSSAMSQQDKAVSFWQDTRGTHSANPTLSLAWDFAGRELAQ